MKIMQLKTILTYSNPASNDTPIRRGRKKQRCDYHTKCSLMQDASSIMFIAGTEMDLKH